MYGPTYTLPAGKTITFSAYISSGDADVFISIFDWSGHTESESLTPGGVWTRLEVSYTNNTSEDKNVCPHILTREPGSFLVDCVQLELSPSATPYNLVESGDFNATNNVWSSSGVHTTLGGSAAPQLDENVHKLPGVQTGMNRCHQTVYISGEEEDTFILSGWGKGNAVPTTEFEYSVYQPNGGRAFGLKARFEYDDNTYSEYFSVDFNPSVENWQYAAVPIKAEKDYSSITVYLVYDNGANEVYFDGIQLIQGAIGTGYDYDIYNNLEKVTYADGNSSSFTYYSQTDDVKTVTNSDGTGASYAYDTYHNVTQMTDNTGVVYQYAYDKYGNQISETVIAEVLTADGQTTREKKMVSSASYCCEGNALEYTTDALGNTTWYTYFDQTGTLDIVEDPEGNIIFYTYDAMYRVKHMETGNFVGSFPEVDYTYSADGLTGISTMTTDYGIEYTVFGERQRIHIDDTTLAFYYYTEDENHYLSALDYSNGDSVYYTYDDKGRRIRKEYTNGGSVNYTYDSKDNLARVTDSRSGITTHYYYDAVDRITKYVENGTQYSHSVTYDYDRLNNLSAVVEWIGGDRYTTSYVYDAHNRLNVQTTDISANSSVSAVYGYDDFGRVTSQYTLKNGSTGVLTKNITYKSPKDGATSNQVAAYTVTAPNKNRSIIYSYTYDANGNILSVSDGTYTTTYEYDSQSQLIRENNEAGGFTYVWRYDDNGNILSRNEYNASGTLVDTVNYSYSNTGWCDLLTSYNGQSIQFIGGNLKSDGTWSYSWIRGTQLASMRSGDTLWRFTYNADGLRTQRTDGTTTYKYVYNGSQLSQMTVGDQTLYFTYDANGAPLSVTYYGVTYYYVTNLQGDVIAVVNSSGNAIATYTYDAWGNILSVGGMSSSFAALNPLRYRGYVYDEETGLYYLQSRYYNPQWGRFISADGQMAGVGGNILGNNLFAYCCNNPINYADTTGRWLETVFDLFSLGVSVVEVVINPLDPWAWAGLAGDALDMIPIVTGLGEGIKGMRVAAKGADLADEALTTIRFAKATDFTEDALDTIKTLDKAGGFTKSTMSAGQRIHKGYKALQQGKEYSKIPGVRMDLFDGVNIFELKPYNKRSLHRGVKQLIDYRNKINNPVSMILEFY